MIRQPGDVKFSIVQGKAELVWNPQFTKRWNREFKQMRAMIGKRALELCEPYIPRLTGRLVHSGKVDDEGTISWSTPYARRQFYTPRRIGTLTGPLRGPFWFERMRQAHKKELEP